MSPGASYFCIYFYRAVKIIVLANNENELQSPREDEK